jgi:hypothetical protein
MGNSCRAPRSSSRNSRLWAASFGQGSMTLGRSLQGAICQGAKRHVSLSTQMSHQVLMRWPENYLNLTSPRDQNQALQQPSRLQGLGEKHFASAALTIGPFTSISH